MVSTPIGANKHEEDKNPRQKEEKPKGPSLLDRIKRNPALVGVVLSSIFSVLVALGILSPDLAAHWQEVIILTLATAGISVGVGVATRSQTSPTGDLTGEDTYQAKRRLPHSR